MAIAAPHLQAGMVEAPVTACHEVQVLEVGTPCSSLHAVKHGRKCKRHHQLPSPTHSHRFYCTMYRPVESFGSALHFKYWRDGGQWLHFYNCLSCYSTSKSSHHSWRPSYWVVACQEKLRRNIHTIVINGPHSTSHTTCWGKYFLEQIAPGCSKTFWKRRKVLAALLTSLKTHSAAIEETQQLLSGNTVNDAAW